MKFYETMYIVHPILEMGRLYDLVLKIQKNLKDNNCEVLYTKVIGKKRMAYPIKNQKFGTYVLVQFKSDGTYNNQFNFDMGNNPNILRHMVISVKESEIEKQTDEIKDQISGLTKPSSDSEKAESKKEQEVEVLEKDSDKNPKDIETSDDAENLTASTNEKEK